MFLSVSVTFVTSREMSLWSTKGEELLRSKFMRSTQKSRSMSTRFYYSYKVDRAQRALFRHVLTTSFMSTHSNEFYVDTF